MCSSCNSRCVQGDVFQNLDEFGFTFCKLGPEVAHADSDLSGQTVRYALLIEHLNVEVPNYRVEIGVFFGTEEFDPPVRTLNLKKAIRSFTVFGYCEDRKSVFKVHRKAIVGFVDEQIVGNKQFLIQKIF